MSAWVKEKSQFKQRHRRENESKKTDWVEKRRSIFLLPLPPGPAAEDISPSAKNQKERRPIRKTVLRYEPDTHPGSNPRGRSGGRHERSHRPNWQRKEEISTL